MRVKAKFTPATLSVGADQAAACLTTSSHASLSPQVSDCNTLEKLELLKAGIGALKKHLSLTPKRIVCDSHPELLTSRFAREYSAKKKIPLLTTQHHHAHALSLMAEHRLSSLLCVTCDGTGYFSPEESWGGEVLLATRKSFKRLAHLEPVPQPGGDVAALKPARMLVSYLSQFLPEDEIHSLLPNNHSDVRIALKQMNNSPLTSSTGRFLDAVSFLLGACRNRTFTGEPAIRLDQLAQKGKPFQLPIPIEKNQLKTTKLLASLLPHLNKKKPADLAASAQAALAKGLASLAITSAKANRLTFIGASGGVFNNTQILSAVRSEVESASLNFIQHTTLQPGDSNIPVGQAYIY